MLIYLALAALYSAAGLWFTHWVVTAPDHLLRAEAAEPLFDDVPVVTFDPRGF